MNGEQERSGAMVEFAPRAQGTGMMQAATTRQAAEVQAAMVIAKQFPRDQQDAMERVIQACRRKTLAEVALYAYPRGGETVTGPSIRLAETLAQAWGNLDFGIVELEQRKGESIVQAYAWDLETNTRQVKVFTVPHERHTKRGVSSLTDPRDVYELTANQGARRLRACILGVIPGDVVEAAVAECDKTLRGDNKEPLAERARRMVEAFGEMGVTKAQIERRLGHKLDALIETELVTLKKVYRSIRDGMSGAADFFEAEPRQGADLGAAIGMKSDAKPEPKAPEPARDPDGRTAVDNLRRAVAEERTDVARDEANNPIPDPPEAAAPKGNGKPRARQASLDEAPM